MLTSTLGIFLDISKAVETIDHKLLCHKLQHYGIRDTAFRGSKAILRTGLNFSSLSPLNLTIGISCGVPQGSVFGPLLICSLFT